MLLLTRKMCVMGDSSIYEECLGYLFVILVPLALAPPSGVHDIDLARCPLQSSVGGLGEGFRFRSPNLVSRSVLAVVLYMAPGSEKNCMRGVTTSVDDRLAQIFWDFPGVSTVVVLLPCAASMSLSGGA